MIDTESSRPQGQIETLFPDVDKLPLTDISPDALQVFTEKWKLHPERIQRIREMTAAFRYDLCAAKIKRLTKDPIFVHTQNPVGAEVALIPDFFGIKDRFDGQCVDIARESIVQWHLTGLIDDINADLQEAGVPGKIVFCVFNGQAEKFFQRSDQEHAWNGLARLDEEGHPVEFVLIDAALQEIKVQNNYNAQKTKLDSKKMTNRHTSTEIGMSLMWKTEDGRFDFVPVEQSILGISQSRNLIFGLQIAHLQETDIYIPVLSAINANSQTIGWFFLDPHNRENEQVYRAESPFETPDAEIELEDQEEIIEILKSMRGFRFEHNLELLPAYAQKLFQMSFDEKHRAPREDVILPPLE